MAITTLLEANPNEAFEGLFFALIAQSHQKEISFWAGCGVVLRDRLDTVFFLRKYGFDRIWFPERSR